MDENGEPVGGFLVFARDDYLSCLEVYENGGGPINPFPHVKYLRLTSADGP
jgi:hypothetical protein